MSGHNRNTAARGISWYLFHLHQTTLAAENGTHYAGRYRSTSNTRTAIPTPRMNLNPLPYHQAMVDYLRSQEPELWKWFSSAQSKAQYTDSLRFALLKT